MACHSAASLRRLPRDTHSVFFMVDESAMSGKTVRRSAGRCRRKKLDPVNQHSSCVDLLSFFVFFLHILYFA